IIVNKYHLAPECIFESSHPFDFLQHGHLPRPGELLQSGFLTFGGSGGMATRKKSQRGRKPREGLRRAASARDPEMDFSGESEEKFEDASKQTSTPRQKAVTEEGETLTAGMVSLMRDFLDAQQKREERHLLELRGLRDSITTAIQVQPTTPSAEESPRMSLPTPRQTTQHTPRSEPQLPTFQAGEDMENFLNRFERMARTWRWPSEEWSYRLVPLLTGQALEAYLAMDEEEAEDYTELRKALLEKFDISPETYRQRFRATTMPAGESPIETYHRLKTLYRRWVRPEQSTKEEIGEIIVLEQLLRVLPSETRTWVKEHEPTSGLAAAKLAQQYVHAHRVSSHRSQPFKGTVKYNTRRLDNAENLPTSTDNALVCYYCQQPGHKASVCPAKKSKLTGLCYVPREENDLNELNDSSQRLNVSVNGRSLNAILDTGSAVSLIKARHVTNVCSDDTIDVKCVHGDVKNYPSTDVTVDIHGQKYLLTVAIVANLPADMILGNDLFILNELLQNPMDCSVKDTEPDPLLSCSVVTRAKARAGLQPLPDFDDSLLQGGSKGPRKTRRQRRIAKYLGSPIPEIDIKDLEEPSWKLPIDIGSMQKNDLSLSPLFKKAEKVDETNSETEHFVVENGVLYAQCKDLKRLVLPKCCRPVVLQIGHSVPWSGHLGHQKTYTRIGTRFFWPTMYTDVLTYCQSCPVCQKTSAVCQGRAPLQPLPIITEPFKRIAMDIVGPLERSKTGNQYILVVSDYATRYPEAFPLRSITTPKVIQALVQLFSRVGIPEEILTDQGTNFTSQLMRQFQQQLGIKSIRTSPYHPQTDGLVERFNQTLKTMLRKFVADTGRDWDKWLPFLLFAYREVPQASTGFSPFELLYGRHVQGPLDMLKRSWEPTTKPSERSIVSYILEMRERLNKYREEATVNLQQAQRAQKLWYDKNCRQREYQPGQKVLLLLPTSANKLLARWQGPYAITRKMGPVTYEVYHPDKGKDKQIYHVNLLKEWKERHCDTAKTALMVRQVSLEEDEDDKLAQEQQLNADIEYLPKQDQTQLLQLLTQFPQLLRQRPGRTTVIQHHIHLTDTTPCRQRPYRVPESLLMPLKQEIQTMLDLGVIEPSESEWSSPLVIVPKKDKSLRVCIDFRKLNSQSRFDAYPMPRIDELLERIGRARFLTTLDLCKGYWQVPLDPASRPYTAFRSPSGLFHFTVLPFGLHGAPATFQRLMDRVLQGCEKWAAAYLDDVIIFSDTFKDHLQHLEETLGRIQRAGLTLNMRKCRWAQKETSYLGYILGNGQIKPQVSKVEAIQRSPRPTTKKEVRSFLGLIGWYRRFIPDFATLATPLTELLTKAVKTPLPWTDECDTAFRNLKNRLCTRSVLQSPDFSQRFLVQVDASATGLGAVLAQGSTGEERPVVFLSRKLLPREQRYSTIEKECLAIKWALESFRYYLLGREFDLETDHRALSWINTMKDHNARVTRWYLSLQPFQFQVRHIPGKMNVVADYLSRVTDGRPPGEGG
ncbi:hypothetical protein M9458_047762, partial [Cirrhinus mrigala]